jgi:microcystin-dependent protein
MSEPFLGEIKLVSFGFAPRGWALCNGQLLPINQNQELCSILGTTFGGYGSTNFALPNFQGRVPLHSGAGVTLGESSGESAHTLTAAEMPAHSHSLPASSNAADQTNPVGSYFAASESFTAYASAPSVGMSPQAVSSAGGSQAHENRPPHLVLSFVIALVGIFPSRD